jgi:signal transduction histidine kinase/ActR/RegA family two-component response regulator
MRDRAAWERLGAHVERAVPPALLRDSPEEARRARLAVAVALLMVPVFGVLAATHAAFGNWREAALDVVLAVGCAVVPTALRAVGRLAPVLNAVLALVFAMVVLAAVVARGAGMSAATVALAEIPLFATLLGGIRTGAAWALLSTVAGLVIGWLGHLHLIVERVPRETVLYDEHSSLLVITATLFSIGALYEMRKNESLRHIALLEEERRRGERERIRVEAEVEAARNDRLTSMGRLAASAAHEINNPLSYVGNNLEFIRRALSEQRAAVELMDAVSEASEGVARIGRIVADLQILAQRDEEHGQAVDVEQALRTALKLAEGQTRAKARVRQQIEPVPRVLADDARLVQVLLNLVLNAAQAIPEGHADSNEISVTVAPFGPGHVAIEVRDTGSGIAPELLDKVKEPFFTTKPIGKGTGLGLSLCDGIVRRYGGRLELESGPGWTLVRVVLEVSPPDASDSAPPVSAVVPGPRATPLHILIVDDEPLVARALARILRGHEVTVVHSGRAALERLSTGEPFDLVFCDVMMPDLSGMEVHAALLRDRPERLDSLVFMTGGTFTERAAAFRESVKNVFLDKPIVAREVLSLVAERAALPVAAERRAT